MSDLLTQDEPAVIINTAHVRKLMRAAYAAPEWALLEEVAPRAGGGTGYADAVAVGLWPSRGHVIHGFEVKVSRSDWLRELKNPAKAEAIFQYCNFWSVVAPDGIIKDGELPPTWGYLQAKANRLTWKVAATKLDAKPVSLQFFASLVRRAEESLNERAFEMQRSVIEAERAKIEEQIASGIRAGNRKNADTLERLALLKEKTGLDPDSYDWPPIATIRLAQQLRGLSDWQGDAALARLTALATSLEQAVTTVREAIAATGLAAIRSSGNEGK